MKKLYILLLIIPHFLHATGGYDNGSPVGDGKLELDFTLNPGNVIEYGQSYITWNYGLTDTLAFHGYVSHEARDSTNQIYYGLKYTFFQNDSWDLSTALGFRHREDETHIYAPQLLYTYKLPNDYDIGGSILDVYDITDAENLGITYDIALRVPFTLSLLQPYIESSKLAFGAFRNASGKLYPTYSIDIKF
ncbi:MAG: Unknown protein [uncultured Sulfurovum sp.]|uniref:Uncharacterized protein n=1 Tax=uncultured Sulfurovum sp. TaxID=269237 RepID=A0A6S6SSI0_9BACT|nr:MAG: Unknown protein [uncultured Sulfurovum sp.]